MNETPNIYKKWEYNQFLEYVKGQDIVEAILYAKLVGIDHRTLEKWYQQPELKEALLSALKVIAEEMRTAGKTDWKFWRELLKIMGIKDEKNIDVTTDGNPINVIIEKSYGTKPKFRTTNDTPTEAA